MATHRADLPGKVLAKPVRSRSLPAMARSSVPTDVSDRMLRVRLSKSPFRWLRTRTAQTPDTGSSESRVLGQRRARDASVSLGPPTHSDRVPVQFARHLLAASRRKLGASPFDVLRFPLAALLLTAAGLKAYQLATEPVLGSGFLDSRWLQITVVEFEFLFGLWLWGGLSPKWTWRAAMVCFGLFAGVSLFKALSGEASCGCFGKLAVNPSYTLLLDLGVVLPRYERLAAELARTSSERRVALVEMPPFAVWVEAEVTQDVGLAVRGHIENTKDWFVETPAELLLDGSIVVRVGKRNNLAVERLLSEN